MWEVRQGNCTEILAGIDPVAFHAIVTDPPYHLTSPDKRDHRRASPEPSQREKHQGGFMNQAWDGGDVAFRVETWAECLRVAKPGAHLLAFGGTRTYHRLACAIEDAGWEVRDCLMWLYGSGFPKSHNLDGEWEGFGTALKPAYEPIILARKPLEGTVAQNVQKHGCGALDIDGSRIQGPKGDGVWGTSNKHRNPNEAVRLNASPGREDFRSEQHEKGRWPANVLLDQESAAMLDGQSGERGGSGIASGPTRGKMGTNVCYGSASGDMGESCFYGDSGGASRFFYTSKASQDERPEVDGIQHPTVKPLDLMRYLVGLVSREGDLILDPFAGSGTTLAAAVGLGRDAIGIETNPEYVRLIEARMRTVTPSLFGGHE